MDIKVGYRQGGQYCRNTWGEVRVYMHRGWAVWISRSDIKVGNMVEYLGCAVWISRLDVIKVGIHASIRGDAHLDRRSIISTIHQHRRLIMTQLVNSVSDFISADC